MKYGKPPKVIGEFVVESGELFLYQYMPIKLSGQSEPIVETRLDPFSKIIGAACCDFIGHLGLNKYVESNIYITAKRMFVKPDKSFNRQGWHSDGFGTDDINYIWSDSFPTIFNDGPFDLSESDCDSMAEMTAQVSTVYNYTLPDSHLLRIDQFCIHKVAPVTKVAVRTFLKLSFSRDIYNLKGNTHNHLLEYKWIMRDRSESRNIPQSTTNFPPSSDGENPPVVKWRDPANSDELRRR